MILALEPATAIEKVPAAMSESREGKEVYTTWVAADRPGKGSIPPAAQPLFDVRVSTRAVSGWIVTGLVIRWPG